MVTPKRNRKEVWEPWGLARSPAEAGADGAAGAQLGAGAARLLPAHLPPSPAGLQQGAGTATHCRPPPHHPRPAAGNRAGCEASSLPHGGADPDRWGPRDYLHGDGRHAAPRTCRAPASFPPAAGLLLPAPVLEPLLGGGAGRLLGGREGGRGGSVQRGAINPGAGLASPAALRGSVFAESAGRLGGAPGPEEGGRADTAGRTRLAGVGSPESEGEGWGNRGGAAPADVRLGLTPLFPNLGDYFAWGADSSRAGRRRRKGPRIRFQPKLAESSVRRVAKEDVHTRALLPSSPALCDLGLLG